MPSSSHNNTQDQKLASIETQLLFIKEELRHIKDNHIAAIYKKLDAQKSWLVSVLVSLVFVLIGVVMNLFTK